MEETYVSVDIESDGPIPGKYSMLSLGAAAFWKTSEKPIDTFSVNLLPLDGAITHKDTMNFWKDNPEAWAATQVNQEYPLVAITRFSEWVESLPGKKVFVGYPAGFDFTFVHWYMMNFQDYDPFSFSALDIKSYAMAVLQKSFKKSTKKNMPKRWFPLMKHSHIAVEDAIEQGIIFNRMLNENLQRETD